MEDYLHKKFGVDNPSKSDDVKSKMKNTCNEKYGVDFSWQASVTKDAAKTTNIAKFGVEYPMQNPEIFEKMQAAGRTIRIYTFKSGKQVKVRGFEPIALDILVKNYAEDDIITSSKCMPEIWYIYNGKNKRYYPDIFIKSENRFIEVKSEYTYRADLSKNLAKQQACLDNNFRFDFMILSDK